MVARNSEFYIFQFGLGKNGGIGGKLISAGQRLPRRIIEFPVFIFIIRGFIFNFAFRLRFKHTPRIAVICRKSLIVRYFVKNVCIAFNSYGYRFLF